MSERPRLEVGDEVGPYRVVETDAFCNRLPVAEIISGPNQGLRVILTSPFVEGNWVGLHR